MRYTNKRRRNRDGSAENALVIDKDLQLNLVVVLLILIGQQSLLSNANIMRDGQPQMPSEAIKLFLTDSGNIHSDAFDGPEISVVDLGAAVTTLASKLQSPATIVLHHGEYPPGHILHQVLWEIEQSTGEVPILALVEHQPTRESDPNIEGGR